MPSSTSSTAAARNEHAAMQEDRMPGVERTEQGCVVQRRRDVQDVLRNVVIIK